MTIYFWRAGRQDSYCLPPLLGAGGGTLADYAEWHFRHFPRSRVVTIVDRRRHQSGTYRRSEVLS